MKIIPVLTILISFGSTEGTHPPKLVDPCKVLCSRDGASVCTHGSQLSTNGICSNYYFRTASRTDHCYTLAPIPQCPIAFPVTGNAAVRRIQVLRYNAWLTAKPRDGNDDEHNDEYAVTGFPFIEISSPRLRKAKAEVTESFGDILVQRDIADVRDVAHIDQ